MYQTLLEEHRTLQTNFDDLVSEKEDVSAQLRHAQREADNRKPDSRGDAIMRAEIDRLRTELYVTVIWASICVSDHLLMSRQKSEDNLAMAEGELDKHTSLITDLTRKVDELQVKADQAARLKDQVDEWVENIVFYSIPLRRPSLQVPTCC